MYKMIHYDNIHSILEQELAQLTDSIQILSAFCTVAALTYVDSKVSLPPTSKRLLVRFRLDDILNGATDIAIYDYGKQHGWTLYIQLDLHAKTFIFDRKRWFVGSANLTANGIGLRGCRNIEMAVLADVDAEELSKIDFLFENSTRMTDEIYALMKAQIARATKHPTTISKWDETVLSLIKNNITTLFTQDFPKSKSPNQMVDDDYSMLGISARTVDPSVISAAFQLSKGFQWLVSLLKNSDGNQLYFGAIAASLHHSLVNDPVPYRKEVKELLANLLSWIIELEIQQVKIERPNHSQLVKLIPPQEKSTQHNYSGW